MLVCLQLLNAIVVKRLLDRLAPLTGPLGSRRVASAVTTSFTRVDSATRVLNAAHAVVELGVPSRSSVSQYLRRGVCEVCTQTHK